MISSLSQTESVIQLQQISHGGQGEEEEMGVNAEEAKIPVNTYLVLLAGFEPPCLQMKKELHWSLIPAATGIKMLKPFHLGPRWDPKILRPCLLDWRSVLVPILLQLHSDDVH